MKFRNEAIDTGTVCPNCGDDDTLDANGLPEFDGAYCFNPITCYTCDTDYKEVYRLVDIIE